MKLSVFTAVAFGASAVLAVPTEADTDAPVAVRSIAESATLELFVRSPPTSQFIKRFDQVDKRDARIDKRLNVVELVDSRQTFLAPITIGTPPQSFLVMVDSGSDELFVFGKNCKDCKGAKTFNPSASSTFHSNNKAWKTDFAGESAVGKYATDTVGLAGYQLKSMSFGLVDQKDSTIVRPSVSGLIGLAQNSAVWKALAAADKSVSPIFTLLLTRPANKNPTSDKLEDNKMPGGKLTIGYVDSKQHLGVVSYTETIDKSNFVIKLDAFTVNGKKLDHDGRAAIDSGTSGIIGPSPIVDAYYKQIPGAHRYPAQAGDNGVSYWAIPCDTKTRVSFTFSGQEWPMNPIDLTSERVGKQNGKEMCAGTFYGMGKRNDGKGAPTWLIGPPFFYNVFVSFQSQDGLTPSHVGFAARPESAPVA